MTIPSSRSLILWISIFSITSPSADFGRLRKTSDFFRRLRKSSEMFGNDRVVFKNPGTPRIKISCLYLRKSWQVQGHILLTYIVYIMYITHYLHIDTCINMTTLHIATNITFTYISYVLHFTCLHCFLKLPSQM